MAAGADDLRPPLPGSIEEIRAAVPALEREVNGQPLAYLDSGASSQRVLASIQAVDRYERRHHANVHRGAHTLSAEATAAYEGARATVADHLGAADRREVIFVRNATEAINLVARAWGDANVGDGDRILLTEMEHHSNIVPWQQLAERVGAEIDWVPVDDEGLLDMDAFAALLERGPKLVAVAHVSNVLGTDQPARRDLPTGARRRRARARRRRPGGAEAAARPGRSSGADFYAIHRPQALRRRPGSAPSGAGSSCCAAMPPFLGGGSMIRKVTRERHHLRRRARPLRGRHAGDRPGDRDGRGAALARRARHGGRARPRARDRRLRPGAAGRGPGLRSSARRAGATGSAPSPSSSRASTPTTSPRSSTATASPSAPATTAPRSSWTGSASPPRPAPASASTRRAERSTAWSRRSTTCAASSSSTDRRRRGRARGRRTLVDHHRLGAIPRRRRSCPPHPRHGA